MTGGRREPGPAPVVDTFAYRQAAAPVPTRQTTIAGSVDDKALVDDRPIFRLLCYDLWHKMFIERSLPRPECDIPAYRTAEVLTQSH